MVLEVPGVPSFEGPDNVCESGLVKAATRTASGTRPTQARVYWNAFCGASGLCINRGGGGVVHRFKSSISHGYRVVGFQRIDSGGAAFPITLALIIIRMCFQDAMWIFRHV